MSCSGVMNQNVLPINQTLVNRSSVPNYLPTTSNISFYQLYPTLNPQNFNYHLINYCAQLQLENFLNEQQVKPSLYLSGNNNEAQAFLSRGGQVIVRMRGLPYDCTAQQVVSLLIVNTYILCEDSYSLQR
jgi:hypothetical protein